MIYFLDGNQEVIKIVRSEAVISAIQTQELPEDNSLLRDYLSVRLKNDERLFNAQYMAIKSYGGNRNAFDLYRIASELVPDNATEFMGVQVAPYELEGVVIEDLRPQNRPLNQTMNQVLEGSDWRIGYVADNLPNVTTNFYYMSVKDALKKMQELTNVEILFKVEISGNKITDKWVEVYHQLGNRTMKRFNYGTNALSVVRESSHDELYTALIGRGKGEEVGETESGDATYGRKINFADVEWKKSTGKPVDKPKGQKYIELPNATAEYGIKLIDGRKVPRIGIVEFSETDDPEKLIQETYQELLVRARPKVLFKASVINTGDMLIGDTVTIHRHDLGFHYQARVRKVVRDRKNNNKTQVEIGDVVHTASTKRQGQINSALNNVTSDLENVRGEVTEAIQSADGKNTNFYGNVEPERKKVGDTWFRDHPSLTGESQILVWNGEAWELTIDTSETTKNADAIAEQQQDIAEVKQTAERTATQINEALVGGDFITLKDLLASKIGDEDFNTLFYQESNAVGLTYFEDGELKSIIALEGEYPVIKGEHILLDGNTLVDGTFQVTEKMMAPEAVVDSLIASGIDAAEINVINLNMDSIAGGDIELSRGFRITNNGETVLSVDNQGRVIFAVPQHLRNELDEKLAEAKEHADGLNYYIEVEIDELEKRMIEAEDVGVDLAESIDHIEIDLSDLGDTVTHISEDVTWMGEDLDEKGRSIDEINQSLGQVQTDVNWIDRGLSEFIEMTIDEPILGDLESALLKYKRMLEQEEIEKEEALAEINNLLSRDEAITAELGRFSTRFDFIDTYMVAGEEGLLVGNSERNTGIRISDNRIDFLDNSSIVAYISNKVMRINRLVTLESIQMGPHVWQKRDNDLSSIGWAGNVVTSWRTVTEDRTIPFTTQRIFDSTIPSGQQIEVQEGKNGLSRMTYEAEFADDEPTGLTRNSSSTVIREMQIRILRVGIKVEETVRTSDLIIDFIEGTKGKSTSELILEFIVHESIGGSVEDPSIEYFDTAPVYDLKDDFGAVGDGVTDDYDAIQRAINKSTEFPIRLHVPDGDYYLKGGTNTRLETWPVDSQGIHIHGTGNAVFYPENNRDNQKHSYYFMNLFASPNSKGVEIEGVIIDGSRNPQEELYFTQTVPADIAQTPMCKGFYINGASEVSVHDVKFRNMYGGYAVHVDEYDEVNIQSVEFDNVGGNDISESFGMFIYLGGHEGDAVVNIDNTHGVGMQGREPDHIAWIGVVLENGTIQSPNEDTWRIDKNTTVNITNSSFMDVQSTFHVESLAGNVYWNVDNIQTRASNYQITAGILGEYKERSNRIQMDMLSYGRLWGIVHGLYYSEKERDDHVSGHNRIDMYNSIINYTHEEGYPIIPQGVAYGDSIKPYLHNCQLNDLPQMLVQNASAILYNSEINLHRDSTQTRQSLQNGWFSEPDVQYVEFNNVGVNNYGNHRNVNFGATPPLVGNEGFVPPDFTEPLAPPI